MAAGTRDASNPHPDWNYLFVTNYAVSYKSVSRIPGNAVPVRGEGLGFRVVLPLHSPRQRRPHRREEDE